MRAIKKARSLVVTILASLLVLPLQAGEKTFPANAGKLDVMSANLYQGADVFRILEAQTPQEVPFKVAEIFAVLQATDFPLRAEAIAERILLERPHVIGLQEVSWWRTGVFDPTQINAEDTVYDFLQLLTDALAARNLDYQVAGVVFNADLEAPLATPTGLVDLRLTDRDVILVRGDAEVGASLKGNYANNASFPLAGGEVEFLRGWVMVPVTVKKREYLVVNTHLETRLSAFGPEARFFQTAQCVELEATVSALNAGLFGDLPVVLTGDLNSDPGDVPYGPLVPPYMVLAGSGFLDTWLLRQGPPDAGLTCCNDELLTNVLPEFDERIDHIFFRPGIEQAEAGPVQSDVVGVDAMDQTVTGLWPSDHGLVSASLKLKGLKQ